MIHDLKTWPAQFEAVRAGIKKFEFRKDDRNFQVGDFVRLQEFEPCKDCMGSGRVWSNGDMDPCGCEKPHGRYTGKEHVLAITYVMRDKESFGLPKSHVVLSLADEQVPLSVRDSVSSRMLDVS